MGMCHALGAPADKKISNGRQRCHGRFCNKVCRTEHEISKKEMTQALTQLVIYVGWIKAWAALHMEKEVYGTEIEEEKR